MNVYKITPGNWLTPGNDSSGKLASPDYYVFFWSAGDDEGYFVQECFKVVGTASVMDAIRWQEANANGRTSATLLPVPTKTDSGTPHMSLYLLNGVYPPRIEMESKPDFGWILWAAN